MKLVTLGLLLSLSSMPAVSVATPACGTLAPCLIQDSIVVLGDDEAAAALLAVAAKSAEQFEHYLGVSAPPIAIVPGGSISSSLSAKLAGAGFETSLPWLSSADKRKLRVASIERQVRAQTEGLPDEQRQAILTQAMQQAGGPDAQSDTAMTIEEQGAFAHELGHLWFRSAFSADARQPAPLGHGYGGWAPDWLDETVALLMENDELRTNRRNAFANTSKALLYPLSDFLTMDHPALASATKLAKSFDRAEGASSRAIVLTGAEAEAFLAQSKAGDPAMFYTQAQGFIDFIYSRTTDRTIFADITRYLATGGSLEDWLETRNDMPESLDALALEWNRWLDARPDSGHTDKR